MSNRMLNTEAPYIEDVLDKYASMSNLTVLALGSSYWGPPSEALKRLSKSITAPEMQRYGENRNLQ